LWIAPEYSVISDLPDHMEFFIKKAVSYNFMLLLVFALHTVLLNLQNTTYQSLYKVILFTYL